MSFHFCSHRWEVRDLDDGTLVALAPRDLDTETIPVMVDELIDLVLENGQANLYLDLTEIHLLPSVVIGKMLALDMKLHEHGGRLILLNVDPFVYRMFQATRLTETIDVRHAELATV